MSDFLEKHRDFKTSILVKDGLEWQLNVELLRYLDGDIEIINDPFISMVDMICLHGSITYITSVFGLPKVGDFIETDKAMNKVIERTFDAKKRIITLGIEP
jgi:hypothetical protein